MAELSELLKILAELGTYYNKRISESIAHLYFVALQDLPTESLTQAALSHIQDSPFFPRISELRSRVSKAAVQADSNQFDNWYNWQAIDALNSSFRGEITETELIHRYGRVLTMSSITEADLKTHLTNLGLDRVDECSVCHGSGCDQNDPERRVDCPNCSGNGYFRFPIINSTVKSDAPDY